MVDGLLAREPDPLSLAGDPSALNLSMGAQPQAGPPQPPMAMNPLGLIATPQQQQQQQRGYMTPRNLNEIYAIMAQGAQNPAQVGQSYVQAMQAQQRADYQRQPMQQWLQLYGNINPYDFTTESLAKFHENTVKTGAIDFNLLERVETLSTKEQGYLNDAIKKAQGAEISMGRMTNLADRFINLAPEMRAGVRGRLSDWMAGIVGSESDVEALRTEYEQFKNRMVVEGLPPGVASDTDIALAMRGWPPSTANPAYIAAFMRGAAKLEAIKYAQAQHEAAYLGRNRTQEGQLAEWNKLRDTRSIDALRRFGGITAPTKPDGSPMSPEEAANFLYGGSPAVGTQTPNFVERREGDTGEALRDVEQSFEEIYKQYSK